MRACTTDLRRGLVYVALDLGHRRDASRGDVARGHGDLQGYTPNVKSSALLLVEKYKKTPILKKNAHTLVREKFEVVG